MKLFSYSPDPMPTGQGLSWRKKHLPFQLIECDLSNKSKELLELNPYGKVPVLVDGDTVIYESAIINEYLDEKYPDIPLMPADPSQRARIRIWIDYCNTRLQRAGGYIAHNYEVEKSSSRIAPIPGTLNEEMQGREYIGERLLAG